MTCCPHDALPALVVRPWGIALLALFALAIACTVVVLRGHARRAPPWAPLALVGLALGALALRWFGAPWTFQHEYLRNAATIDVYLWSPQVHIFGELGPALYRAAAWAFGGEESAVFGVNALLGALTAPATALLVLALGGRFPAALFAGLLLAVSPHHLRLSPSEELYVPGALFAVWSLALLADHLARPHALKLGASLALLVLACETRVDFLLFAGFLPALVVCTRGLGGVRLFFKPWALAAMAGAAGMLVPWALRFFNPESGPPGVAGLRPALLTNQLFFDPEVTPVLSWLFLAAGLGWWLRRATGRGLFLVLVAQGCVMSSIFVFHNWPYDLRTQVMALPFFAALCGGAAGWAAEWTAARPRARVAAAALLTAAALSSLLTHRSFVTEEYDQQREWRFLTEAVPKLPAAGRLLTVRTNRRVAEGRPVELDAFPTFVSVRARKRMRLLDLTELADSGAYPAPPPPGAPAAERLYFYQGLYCFYAQQTEPLPEPMTARCLGVTSRYLLRPLVVEEVHARRFSPGALTGDGAPFTLGFYEVVGLRARP